MKVTGLALTNIKRHIGTVQFDPMADGVLLLLGRNGRGKSTVPQALSLAVFGTRPMAFRGSSGDSLVGFVNRQCSEGEIRAIVEFPAKQQTLTFVVKLDVKTNKHGEFSNTCRHSVYEGAQALTGELPRAQAKEYNITAKALRQFIKQELRLPLAADQLCDNLLSPPQSGGLTSYFSLTASDRKTRTEEMLGLHPIRRVVAALRSMINDTGSGLKRLVTAFDTHLAQHAEQVPALSGIRKTHGGKTKRYESLDVGVLRAAFNGQRATLVSESGEAAAQLAQARQAVDGANVRWTQLSQRNKAFGLVVKRQEALSRAKTDLSKSEAAEKRQIELEPLAKAWQAASDTVDACVREERARTEARRSLESRKAKAEAFLEGAAGREEGRTRRLKDLDAEEGAQRADLERVQASLADWSVRSEAAQQERTSTDAMLVDLTVLVELHAAVSGVRQIKDREAKLQQVREALSSHRLPDSVSALVSVISGQLGQADALETGEDGGWADHLAALKKTARERQTRCQGVMNALASEKAVGEQEAKRFERAQGNRDQERTRIEQEAAGESAKQDRARQVLEELAAEAAKLEEQYGDLDQRRQDAQAIKNDPERKAAHEGWLVAQGEARQLQHHRERVQRGETQLREAMDAVGEDGLPSAGDTEAWAQRARQAELAVFEAQAVVKQANDAQSQAYAALQRRIRVLRDLDGVEEQLVADLRVLEADRAKIAELKVFDQQVVQLIPKTIAGRVVSQVSGLANDFFQQVYVQAAEPSELKWSPDDYRVSIARPSGTIPAKHASGGEKMALGIALNLAVLHFMAPAVRWLVLDEPTASLDEENRAGLRDFVKALREPISGRERLFDQMLFISHESKLFEGLGDAIIFEDDGPV